MMNFSQDSPFSSLGASGSRPDNENALSELTLFVTGGEGDEIEV